MTDFNVERTAITHGIAKSIKIFMKYIDSNQINKIHILDYGCGKVRNSKYLVQQGFIVDILDTDKQINILKKEDKLLFDKVFTTNSILNDKYDIIFNTFVLNVISEKEIREKIVLHMFNLLKNNGFIIFEVRNKNSIDNAKYKKSFKDGYLMGNSSIKTFQKVYNKEDLESFITSIAKNNHIHYKIHYSANSSGSVILIIKKEL